MNLRQLQLRLDKAVYDGAFPGCSCGIVVEGETHFVSSGRVSNEPNSPLVEENTIYDVASVTKAIPTASLALKCIEYKKFSLSSALIEYVPEFTGSFRDEITLFHLLTHTLDFDFRLSSCKDLPPKEILNSILNAKMQSKPGLKFCYANATSILLGLMIERAMGTTLDILADRLFFKPLELKNTSFFTSAFYLKSIVPSEIDPWRNRVILGEVHDESAWALRPFMIAGSAGLFSTVLDLARFVQVILFKGEFQGNRFFNESTIKEMHTNQRPYQTGEWAGLGWELNQPYMGKKRTVQTFGKTGFTGCAVVICPERETGIILLSNYTYPCRKNSREMINQIRSDIADLVFDS